MGKFDFSSLGRDALAGAAWSFTDDERKALSMRLRGRHNVEIAAELNCSERTVNRLVRSLRSKIG